MMKQDVSDPNNHAPEVSPEDEWGDAADFSENPGGPGTLLPPRRTPEQGSEVKVLEDESGGLRIDARPERLQADEPVQQLEVQEIDGRVLRLAPEESDQPRMPRLDVPIEKGPEEPREIESKEWGLSRKYSWRWLIGISLGIAAVVVISISLLPSINRSNAEGGSSQQGKLTVDDADLGGGRNIIEDLLTRQAEAEQVYRKFATAPIVDDLVPLLRDRQSVEPLVRASRSGTLAPQGWTPEKKIRWNVVTTNGRPFGILHGVLPDFSEFDAYFVLNDDLLHLDWPATTGYGTATFDELSQGLGDPSGIRGTIKPAGYYSPVFPEKEYQSYQLIGPDGEKAIWCYTRRGEDAEESISRLFRGGDIMKPKLKPHKVTLRLERGPEQAYPNQWLVWGMLHEDWISP